MTTEALLQEAIHLCGILVAALLGFAIGYERKMRFKEAGIRTHTIVCIGSALMTIVSKYGFGGEEADAARVAAQIVTGIGFLGAGIIVYRRHEIHGLTTAAGVWATAGVGMAAGAELYLIAVGATLIIIAVQCLFHTKWKPFRTKKYYQIKICFVCSGGEEEIVKALFGTDRFKRLVIEREGENTVFCATLNTDCELSPQRLGEIMKENPFIRSVERCDES